MSRQLALPLKVRPALGRGDFFVAPPNAVAVALIDGWRDWPGGKLLLCGPVGSGKTHLAHVWSAESFARIVPARRLAQADIPALAQGHVCVEDVQAIAGQPEAENALFHLHNLVLANGNALLLTADTPPAQWPLTLPDLKSRMMGTPLARLEPPDDELLSVVLAKLFADQQIVPAANVIPYLVRHMPRSFDMAGRMVAALDAAALAGSRRISRDLAREVLAHEEQYVETTVSPLRRSPPGEPA
ncbi:DnaA ATPase domain-containing protein [Aestuariicoccus sp. MJ-SS9]|uniref:DnaA/Hda family protein n=1 Tax=Aestuariicoccus sp. MJ-SS9 TaxID=3079855 RepID=UPI0029151823|nr:DnaA/Hda family protein [Aestuariicoccus sp. MJ-SS9]MDU8913230.1 DnaA/Hda family protein [Aestuariicoccus sp. MJ-SS9]